jgi:hypothetical protein
MSMHLEGPWLTTTGKIKSKRRKYASADAARKARELKAEWEQRQAEWAKLAPKFSKQRSNGIVGRPLAPSLQYPPGREPQEIPSLDTGVTGAVTVKATPQYTGTKIKGIGTMHKSNAVPIFSDEDAVAIAHMRR